MPLKELKAKTPQQLMELLELFEWRISCYSKYLCPVCALDVALYTAQIHCILWTLGRKPTEFCRMIRRLKRERLAIAHMLNEKDS